MTAPSTASLATRGMAADCTPTAWKPDAFAAECARIVETMRGHEAHRALDLLTNQVLNSLGFGEGIAVFERAVAHWHAAADVYPYPAACPDCRRAA